MPNCLRPLLSLLALLIAGVAVSQSRALSCFFSADFETPEQFDGWDLGAEVERQSPTGTPLGEFVPAWSIGDAQDADAAGYFPVPDQPFGNTFAMVNDAAPPCNCDLAQVALTTPTLDLTGRTGVALECRVYYEGTFGAGPALVQVSTDDGPWSTVVDLPVVANEWQNVFVDLSAFDDQADFRLRFLWSDAGAWASGFAVDDVCFRERFANDASIMRVLAHDVSISPFNAGDQSLRYHQLPLEQAGPLVVSVEVRNSGTDMLRYVGVSTSLFQNGTNIGPFPATPIDSLVPGERVTVQIATGWEADAYGELDVFASVGANGFDEDVNDNSGLFIMHITGPGWDNGYGTMSSDAGSIEGTIGNSGGYIAANRMEIIRSGSHAEGISVQLGTGTNIGAVVRAILTDASLALIDTSVRHIITEADLERIYANGSLYFPLSATPSLETGDVFVGIQHLSTSANHIMEVGISGEAPVGASILREGSAFTLSYLRATPMVRLHLSAVGVGVEDQAEPGNTDLQLYPVPASTTVRAMVTTARSEVVNARLVDASGRIVRAWSLGMLPAGNHGVDFPVAELAEGIYSLLLTSGSAGQQGRIVIAR